MYHLYYMLLASIQIMLTISNSFPGYSSTALQRSFFYTHRSQAMDTMAVQGEKEK